MDWREAAAAFPLLEEKDIAHLQLSKEENEQVITLFNRAVSNAQTNSADISMIALKKLLTQFPAWGEAALLYGVCLAIEGKFRRAAASFEHAVSAGVQTEELSYMAQVYYRDAGMEYAQERQHILSDEEEDRKSILASVFPRKNNRSGVFREIDSEERGHMQAPILTRVPRANAKAKLATDRERRDVMMQASSPKGDNQDEEIDVSIPKTPAEKLRMTVIAVAAVFLAVVLGLVIGFFILPGIASMRENKAAAAKLEYLTDSLEAQKANPQILQILSDYYKLFPAAAAIQTSAAAAVTPQATAQQTKAPAQESQTTLPQTTGSLAATPSPAAAA